MNKENLFLMADYIEKVPQVEFDMVCYRTEDTVSKDGEVVCNSVACVIGHCINLVPRESLPLERDGDINYSLWSMDFTGLGRAGYAEAWTWCFGTHWGADGGGDNTPIGAAKRIRYLIEKGLPTNWLEQMNGKAPLSY